MKSEAESAALASARRDLSIWLYQHFHSSALWYATEHERSNPGVTPARVDRLASELAARFAADSTRADTKVFRRCDGHYEAYVRVEIEGDEIPAAVAKNSVEELSGTGASTLVRKLEEKLSADLLPLPAYLPVSRIEEPKPTNGSLKIHPGVGLSISWIILHPILIGLLQPTVFSLVLDGEEVGRSAFGNFHIKALPPGSYSVRVREKLLLDKTLPDKPSVYCFASTVAVSPGEETTVWLTTENKIECAP